MVFYHNSLGRQMALQLLIVQEFGQMIVKYILLR